MFEEYRYELITLIILIVLICLSYPPPNDNCPKYKENVIRNSLFLNEYFSYNY